MRIGRRAFLIGVGGTLAGGAAAERTTAWARRRPVREWVEELSVSASAQDLGIEYLARTPAEADQSVLIAHLAGLVPPTILFGGGGEGAPAGFNEQVRRDFVEGDIVRMGGWLLSRTELRLCALVARKWDEAIGVSGVFAPLHMPNGETIYWTTPAARFTVPANTTPIEFRLCSGARKPQQVAVRMDGVAVAELPVSGREWQQTRYPIKPTGRPIQIELTTTPEWKPSNDFRTMGIGIDRIWRA